MKHYLLATLLLIACRESATHASKAVIIDYKQADNPQAFTQFVRQVVPVQRVSVIYFYADWCGPCRRFRTALPSVQVDEALRQTTVIKVNIDSSKALAAYYNVTAVPTFVKVDKQGEPLATITSAEWGEDVPAEIAPVMAKLVSTTTYDSKK